MKVIDCIQGSDEWIQARLGMVTSSHFKDVLNKKAGRLLYMRKVVGEILSGVSEGSFSNKNMENGIGLEDEARQFYELVNSCEVKQVGFIKMNDIVGSSPDGLVGEDGQMEIKCVIPSTQIATILSGKMPSLHNGQVQGQMYVSGRKWTDFVSYCPLLKPRRYFSVRVRRDEEYINNTLDVAVKQFVKELKEMIDKLTKSEF